MRDPRTQLHILCSAIELPFSAVMLDHSGRAAEVIRTTSHPEYHRQLAMPPTPGLRDWRRELSADDVARFELLAGDALTEFGYERHERRPSLAVGARRRRTVVPLAGPPGPAPVGSCPVATAAATAALA